MADVAVDNSMLPAEATDSPIWKHLQRRGRVDINDSYSNGVAPLNIYYEIYGSGTERIVFVNGMRADHQMWESNIEQFLKLGNYECLVYDHRSTGHSDPGKGLFSFTSSGLASDLKKLMNALKWSKANIVSVSMGGIIALEFACNSSEMVKTLTLGATTPGIYIPPLTSIVDTLRIVFSQTKKQQLTNICLSSYTREHLESPAPGDSGCSNMLDYYLATAKRKAKYRPRWKNSTAFGQLLSVFRHRVSPFRLVNLGTELPNKQVLIVVGAKDRIIDPRDSAYLADCIGRQKVIFESFDNAEHAIYIQESERFVRSIDSMISTYNNQNFNNQKSLHDLNKPQYCSPNKNSLIKILVLWETSSAHLAFRFSTLFLSLGILLQLAILLM